MKRRILVILIGSFISSATFAQKVDSLQKKHIKFLKKYPSITDVKAQ